MERWRWRGGVALLAVALAFVLYPLLPNDDVINSDWPAFDTGARLIVHDPAHLYDFDVQRQVQLQVTGGRSLVGLSIHGILPFLAPPWVALIAVPFDLLGPNLGGRLWVLSVLACLAAGLLLATRPRPPQLVTGARSGQPAGVRVPDSPDNSAGSSAKTPDGRDYPAMLPAFASVPTAVLMLNAQLDGIVALGIGAAIALWSRPFFAGLALGLTLVKPQLVLPIGFAVLLTRQWRVLAGWVVAGVVLVAVTLALNPHWISEWLPNLHTTVAPGSREVDLAHFGTAFPAAIYPYAVAVLSLVALVATLVLAARRRDDFRLSAAILVIGGVLVSPHALPSDLVLIAVGLAIWGEATWVEWLALSVITLLAALTPAPVPAALGVLLMLWLMGEISLGRRLSELASAR